MGAGRDDAAKNCRQGKRPARPEETPEIRRIMRKCQALAGDSVLDALHPGFTAEVYPDVNVRETRWIDEAGRAAIDHDNESEEVVRSYGGGD
jgi:hypothetical protein